GGGLLGIAASFGPLPETFDVLARVSARARRTGRRLRSDVPAAHVRVEGGAADAEPAGRLLGGPPGPARHISFGINIDTPAARAHDRTMAAGLEGVVAATTRLSEVDGERGELVIGGYPVGELAARATFEETTWLLWHGDLPGSEALDRFRADLAA